MFTSFLMAIVAIVLRLLIAFFGKRWDFFNELILPFSIAMWVAIAIFAIFTVIFIIKKIKDV